MNEWQKFGSGEWIVDVCNWVIAAKGGATALAQLRTFAYGDMVPR